VSLGLAERQDSLLDDMARFCDQHVPDSSIYAVLHRERDKLFPDEMFSDLSAPRGALTYPLRSKEGLEVISLGPMAYLEPKGEGENSMPSEPPLVPRRMGRGDGGPA
jgi:hypothetical protein